MRLVSYAIITAFFILLPLNLLSAESMFDSDVRILESDESGITFTYTAPPAELITPDGYPEKYKAPQISRTAQIARPGAPLLPVKMIPVGIPFDARPSIKIISQRFTPIARVDVPNYITARTEADFRARTTDQDLRKNWPASTAYIDATFFSATSVK